jgi:uncharacterized protein (DUF2249 family)
MKTMHDASGEEQPPTPAAVPGGPAVTLAGEHALLLGQVVARAGNVLAVTAGDRWPARELQALVGYLRAEVLGQDADEERLLFPAGASAGVSRLARDHARLRAAIETLERVAAGEVTWSPAELAAATRDLLRRLERHLHAGEAVLAADGPPGEVPATTVLGGRPRQWYPLTEGPVIDLDALPPGQMIDAATERLLRLRRGEQVELRSGRDPWLVWRRMDDVSPGGYGFAYLQDGPDRWRMQVTRRRRADRHRTACTDVPAARAADEQEGEGGRRPDGPVPAAGERD